MSNLVTDISVKGDEYLENALNMTIFGTNYAFSKLREKVSSLTIPWVGKVTLPSLK